MRWPQPPICTEWCPCAHCASWAFGHAKGKHISTLTQYSKQGRAQWLGLSQSRMQDPWCHRSDSMKAWVCSSCTEAHKFRSQTSNFRHMDRCSNSGGNSQKRESKKKEDQSARKGRKVARHCVAHRCGAKHISKTICQKHLNVGALLEVESLQKCTPLWRKARFQVKMLKTPQVRNAFGSWAVQKVHAAVVRSAFPSQKRGPLFEVRMWYCVAGAMDSTASYKWAKPVGFAAASKTMACVGHLKRTCKDAFRVAGAVQETSPSEGQGADFLRGLHDRQVCYDACGWQVRQLVLHEVASLFRGRHHTLDRWSGKIAKRIGTRPPGLLSISFLKEVSQNCFVFDPVHFKNWRSFAEFFVLEQRDRERKERERGMDR